MRRLWVVCCCLITACQTLGHDTQTRQTGEPTQLPSVLATPVDFAGWRGEARDAARLNEIRIGLFAPDDSTHPVSGPMFKAAHLAIDQVNASGGFEGRPFRLVSRWDHDPWRGGSKQMIKLVYEDSVWAVIGSVDGSATHIAEQVVTKAWLPLISPVSADPTLTHIRIPWMFRLPPDDEKQAAVLVHDGIQAASLKDVGLVTSTDHDGRIFAAEMLVRMQGGGVPPVFHLEVPLPTIDITHLARRISSFAPDALVLRLPPTAVLAMLDQLEHAGFRAPLLIPWIPGLSPTDLRGRYSGDIWYVQPFSQAGNPAYVAFARMYRDQYHTEPSPSAAYTYDAIHLLVRALRNSGLNRADLRDAIAGMDGFRGVTGTVSWDNAGGNQAQPVLEILAGSSPLP